MAHGALRARPAWELVVSRRTCHKRRTARISTVIVACTCDSGGPEPSDPGLPRPAPTAFLAVAPRCATFGTHKIGRSLIELRYTKRNGHAVSGDPQLNMLRLRSTQRTCTHPCRRPHEVFLAARGVGCG